MSITGSRADYGLMRPIHSAIVASPALKLDLIVTGMHLLPEFSTSLEQVRLDKLGVQHEIEMDLATDSGRGMARSIGGAISGIADIFEKVSPDIALVLGDRSEILATAIVAAHMNVPIVHLCGGDFSGSIDDSVRNAVSKLAHFHLTSCKESSQRLVSIGESPDRIVEVGNPGLDALKNTDLVSLEKLVEEFRLPPGKPFLLATVHPVTDDAENAPEQMAIVLKALAETGIATVFTYPNSDHGGRAMMRVLESWRGQPFLRIEPNLGSQRYFSLMRHAGAVVGNSSSGILEAPSFRVPVVNIGSRQFGRVQATNIVNAPFEQAEIVNAIKFVLEDRKFRSRLSDCTSPYGDGKTSARVVDILSGLRLGHDLIAKWLPAKQNFLD